MVNVAFKPSTTLLVVINIQLVIYSSSSFSFLCSLPFFFYFFFFLLFLSVVQTIVAYTPIGLSTRRRLWSLSFPPKDAFMLDCPSVGDFDRLSTCRQDLALDEDQVPLTSLISLVVDPSCKDENQVPVGILSRRFIPQVGLSFG